MQSIECENEKQIFIRHAWRNYWSNNFTLDLKKSYIPVENTSNEIKIRRSLAQIILIFLHIHSHCIRRHDLPFTLKVV